jgi:hypothetical protein
MLYICGGVFETSRPIGWSRWATSRPQWPRCQRRGSTAAPLLGFGFESRRGHACLSLVSFVCCQEEVSAMSWSLVQRSPTECGVSKKCDREASIMRRPRPPRSCRAVGKKMVGYEMSSSYAQ